MESISIHYKGISASVPVPPGTPKDSAIYRQMVNDLLDIIDERSVKSKQSPEIVSPLRIERVPLDEVNVGDIVIRKSFSPVEKPQLYAVTGFNDRFIFVGHGLSHRQLERSELMLVRLKL